MNSVDLMLKYIEEQDLEKAQKQFEKIKRDAAESEIFEAAEQLIPYGFYDEAKQLLEILLTNYPEESELKVMIAELCIEMGNDEEAYHYLETIQENDSQYPSALLMEADLYQMQGLYEVSEHKLKKAKEILKDNHVIDYALAELYMTQGRFLEATRIFQTIIEKGVDELGELDLYSRLAEALSAGGAYEEAIPYYEKSLHHKKEINVQFGYALTCYQAGIYTKAIEAFQQLKEMDPDYHSLYLYLARSYEFEGKIDEALKEVEAGILLDEFNKDLQFYAGKLALKKNDEDKAEKYLRESLTLDPEFIEAALTLNKLFIHQERYEDVIDITSIFDEQGIVDPQLAWDAAISYEQTEQYDLAIKQYEAAYIELNNNEEFLRDYGYFLIEEGRRDKALRIFEQLLNNDPNNEEWIQVVNSLNE